MAKEKAKDESTPKAAEPQPAAVADKGKVSLVKVAIILGLVLLLEGGTVVMTMMLSGGPKSAQGHDVTVDTKAEDERLVELQVARDQFPNQKTGHTYLYDTEIFITVKKKDSADLKKKVESMQATLSTDIAVIFRRAEPAILTEPTLGTLSRQIKAALDERLGKDAQGQPLIHEVLIRKCIQFRADG